MNRRRLLLNFVPLAVALGVAVSGCEPAGLVAGATAPDAEVQPLAIGGKPVNLSQYKGKVVILDFWATWCGPCRQSFPHMQQMYDSLKSKGFEIVAVSDEDPDVIDKFVRKNGYTFNFYRDPFRVAFGKYKVGGLPTTFVINRDGKIVGKTEGFSPQELESYVDAAL